VRYVWVVDKSKHKVSTARVQLGPVIDGLRVVQSGLSPGRRSS